MNMKQLSISNPSTKHSHQASNISIGEILDQSTVTNGGMVNEANISITTFGGNFM